MPVEERIAMIQAKKTTLVKQRTDLQMKLNRLRAKMESEAKETEEKE